MRNEYNGKEANYVYTPEDIELEFDNFQKMYMPDISDENYIDLFYRILYFFNHSQSTKLSPENNDDLYFEEYGDTNTEHKSLMTVPKNVNKYADFLKGNYIPVCKFKKDSPNKSFDNEFVISIDTEKNIVLANVTTTKHIYKMKNSKQPLKSHCYCVANYCIPSTSEIIRGKSEDILSGKVTEIKPLDFSADYEKFEETISQCVLHIGRMDIDVEHKNTFVFEDGKNMFSEEEMKLLNKYFGEIAGPPHFHFVYKDYVLAQNRHDSSALAINVNGLTSYLVDLNFTDKSFNDSILNFDFGMPFNDIKKSGVEVGYEDVTNLLSGITAIYSSLSEEEKQTFMSTLLSDLKQRVNEVSRVNKTGLNLKIEQYSDMISSLCGIITNSNGEDAVEQTFDPIALLSFEASALNQIHKLSFANKNLEYDIAKVGNNFYSTVEYCLSESCNVSKENGNVSLLNNNEESGMN